RGPGLRCPRFPRGRPIMRLSTLPPTVTIAMLTFLGACSADTARDDTRSQPSSVHIKGMSYEPRTLEIAAGDAVVWINDAHATHTEMSEETGHAFDTGDILPAQTSKPIRFASPGEYKYHCRVHGKAMSGTIVVRAVGTR